MRRFLGEDDARGTVGDALLACLIAAAAFVVLRAFDPLVDSIRQIIQTQVE